MIVLGFAQTDIYHEQSQQKIKSRRGIYSWHDLTSVDLRIGCLVESDYCTVRMPEIATTLAGTGKRASLLWQMARQSVGQPIDWAASGCDLCLPFLSHLKGEVSGSDRVMYKSSTWLVTPRWALYQPSCLSSCKTLHGKRVVFDVKWWRGIYFAELWGKKQHEYNNPLNSD